MSYELSVANIALSDYCVTRAGLLFLLRCALRSLVWKGKSNIELRIESEGGIEGLAAFALQAFDYSGLPFCQKFGDLLVGQLLVTDIAEYFQTAIHIAALGYLVVKQHVPPLALGAYGAIGCGCYGDGGIQEFGRDLCGIDFYSTVEGVGIGSPVSILARALSQLPVMDMSAIFLSLTMECTASPFSVGTSDFFSRRI